MKKSKKSSEKIIMLLLFIAVKLCCNFWNIADLAVLFVINLLFMYVYSESDTQQQ